MVGPGHFVSLQSGEETLYLPDRWEGRWINIWESHSEILSFSSVLLLQLGPATRDTGFHGRKLRHPHTLLFIICGCKCAIFLLQHGKGPWPGCLASLFPAEPCQQLVHKAMIVELPCMIQPV